MGFTEIYERIKLAANCRTQVELAELLNIRQSSISDAKRRDSVPGDWYMKLFERFGLNPDWLKYGVGPLYLRTEKGYCPQEAPLAQYYKGVVTDANARLCRRFITANSTAFRQAEQRYGVPSSIAAALLFVETRLGKVLGDTSENAFYTLASMAVSRTPESISDWLPQLRDHAQHMDWIAETMPKRADWAYKETRALVEHMLRDRVPPEHLPGSIYGAVGLCQFMPSNIATYGADGDGDGRVDLFTVPDAVASLSHYLARHGWKAGLSRERQHALLMRYNHSTVYANTILALADRVAALK